MEGKLEGVEGELLMGLVRDFLIKDKDKRFWLTLALDVFIIIFFIFLSLRAKHEWNAGFNACMKNACWVCWNQTGQINTTIRSIMSPFEIEPIESTSK